MAGGYYKRGWQFGLEMLDEWWFWSTDYYWNAQDGFRATVPDDYQRWTNQLVEFVRETAKQDPTPFWDVGRLIAEHARLGKVVGGRYPVTPYQIWNAIDRAVVLKDWLFSHGTTNKRAGRKKTAATETVEKLIVDGLDNDAIVERTGETVGNVRTIRSRLNGK